MKHSELKSLISKVVNHRGASKTLALNELRIALKLDSSTSEEMTMKVAQITYTKLALKAGF